MHDPEKSDGCVFNALWQKIYQRIAILAPNEFIPNFLASWSDLREIFVRSHCDFDESLPLIERPLDIEVSSPY